MVIFIVCQILIPLTYHGIERVFATLVFRMLLEEGMISEELAKKMRTWKHSGFSVYRAEPIEAVTDKTRLLRFSRYYVGLQRRFTFLGFEFYWKEDHKGNPCVTRRTAPKKLQSACLRIKDWIKCNRHLRGKEFFRGLNHRLRGHYNYYGIIGNSRAIDRIYFWSLQCTFKWLNRRGGKRKSYDREHFKVILKHVGIARPRITQKRYQRVFA